MLVSVGQGIMRLEVTYRVSRIAHVVHFLDNGTKRLSQQKANRNF